MIPEEVRARQDEFAVAISSLLDEFSDILQPAILAQLNGEDDLGILSDASESHTREGWALAMEHTRDKDDHRWSYVQRFAPPFQTTAHTIGILNLAALG